MILEMTTAAMLLYAVPKTGNSESARFVETQSELGRERLQASYFLGMGGKGVFEELLSIAEECSKNGWAGEGAEPVTDDTYRLAYRVLEALPLGTPAPSIGAEPDGHLTLDWARSPRRTLSVSVSPEGDLHYAALLGAEKSYGTRSFSGAVPKVILDLINEVYNG